MRCAIGWLVLVAVGYPAAAGVKLILEDGQVIEGRSVERKESMYLLTLETENVLPIPALLVAQVEWTAEDGLTKAEPRTLAGNPAMAKLPTLTEQMQVLRDSTSVFQSLLECILPQVAPL